MCRATWPFTLETPASCSVSVQQLWPALQALIAWAYAYVLCIGIAGCTLRAYAAKYAVCNMAVLCQIPSVLLGC